jgi:hypothetical protein
LLAVRLVQRSTRDSRRFWRGPETDPAAAEA